jgi:hypothetical protein
MGRLFKMHRQAYEVPFFKYISSYQCIDCVPMHFKQSPHVRVSFGCGRRLGLGLIGLSGGTLGATFQNGEGAAAFLFFFALKHL